ncbi:hypothetical protein GGF46_000604 [Coemansia sp. RSA 552]|nr:hypothetical protein GGF46_000604 [Coemansia sp. RSA 552]
MAERFRAKAHHNYTKTKPDELGLAPGDIIRVTNDEHSSWWVGTNEATKESGWFPSNFVDRIEGTKAKPKLKRRVRVVQRYAATDDEDLSLEVGDIVDVKKEVDEWCLGRLHGKIGMFPASHVEEYEEDPAARPLPQPPTALSRRSTSVSTHHPEAAPPSQPQAVPPTLPKRNPPLPPRASTDIGASLLTSPLSEEDGDAKKEKKAGRRISRLFGSKKKTKDTSAVDDGQPPSALVSPIEDPVEIVAAPSRPLPQPIMTSPPPPAARALPPAPTAAPARPPPVPAPQAVLSEPGPVPAPMPPPPAPARRPSTASVDSGASVPPSAGIQVPPLPPIRANEEVKPEEDAAGDDASTAADKEKDDAREGTDSEPAESSGKPRAKLAKITEDYEAQSPEELNLMQGDVVTIISRGTDDEQRWKGEYHGKKGYFPGTVVEPIEESAGLDEEDEADGAGRPKGGFKLAAYGVQQGGLGSIFAGGGMPALRKSAPRKTSESEADSASPSPAPAPAPAVPKLRNVQRVPPKDTTPKEEEQQPNFLAQLNRVPRRSVPSASSEESGASPHPMAAAPSPAMLRKASSVAETTPEPEQPQEPADLHHVPETSATPVDAPAVPQEPSNVEEAAVPKDEEPPVEEAAEAVAAEEYVEPEEAKADARTPTLDPVKSPALSQVKRLVRRGPRQMPTPEGLRKSSGESQSRSLHSALEKDKDLEPEPEPTKPTPPPTTEKPKGLRHGSYNGPQLPVGGFKASGRVGSAMAERLAALQARASRGADEEESPNRVTSPPNVTSPPPPPASKKPSFTSRAAAPEASPTPPGAAPAANGGGVSVSLEWKRKIEDEQQQLRSMSDQARRSNEQVEQLATRLEASERENQAHKQTISGLERQIESLVSQLASLKTDISQVQRSVSDMGDSKGVSANEVSTILRSELQTALDPVHKQNQELRDDSKRLDKKIDDLRSYVDELVVEEEEE